MLNLFVLIFALLSNDYRTFLSIDLFCPNEKKPKKNFIVNISDFGAKGNGVDDDSAAFSRFNNWAKIQNGKVILHLDKDRIYVNSNNCFTYNIRYLTIEGNNSTIRNPARNNSQRKGFNTAAGMNKRNKFDAPSAQVDYFLINSTNTGDTVIELKNKNDCVNLKPGEWLCIGSHDVYPVGFPPNFKYYEFVKVMAVNFDLGRLTIDRPLIYSHKEDAINWSGNVKFTGKASIYRIEQGSNWEIDQTFNDLTFETPSQQNKTGDYVTCSGYKITLNRCKAYAFNPSVAGTVKFKDCISMAYSEFDKLVDTVIDNRSKWIRISNGAGIKYIELNNSKINIVANLSPRKLIINGIHFKGSEKDFQIASGSEMDYLKIAGGSFDKPLNSYTTNFSQNNPLTLGKDGVRYNFSTNELIVPCNKYSLINQLKLVSIDQVLSVVTSEAGNAIHTPYFGRISKLRCLNDTTYIQVSFNKKLNGNESLIIFKEPKIVSIQNVKISEKITNRNFLKQSGKSFEIIDFKPVSTASFVTNNFFGFPKRITINVKRPYTGLKGNSIFSIGFNEERRIDIDLKSKGIRTITYDGATGFKTDKIENFSFRNLSSTFINRIVYHSTIDFSTEDDSKRPIIDVSIQF